RGSCGLVDREVDACSGSRTHSGLGDPRPKSPRDLLQHRCINFRHGRDEIYRWEFDKGKQSLTVAVNGPLIVDDVDLVIRAALDGVGLAYLGEDRAAPHLDSGALVRVLEQWCQPFPGFFLP